MEKLEGFYLHCISNVRFVLGFNVALKHIVAVPTCSSGTSTSVLPHGNAMPHTHDTTPHAVTIYRHRANLPFGVERPTGIHNYPS